MMFSFLVIRKLYTRSLNCACGKTIVVLPAVISLIIVSQGGIVCCDITDHCKSGWYCLATQQNQMPRIRKGLKYCFTQTHIGTHPQEGPV